MTLDEAWMEWANSPCDEPPQMYDTFSAGWNAALKAPAASEPFAYFQWNSGWATWEQVSRMYKSEEGVVPLYDAPHPTPALIEAAKEVVKIIIDDSYDLQYDASVVALRRELEKL